MTTLSVEADSIGAPATRGLSFRKKGGPLLAIVGLCGGAGVSTLTLLAGLAAARASSVPVMICDTGGPSGGLAAYAGVETRLSIAQASHRLARDEPVRRGDLIALTALGRLRIIAAAPEWDGDGDERACKVILDDARLAHGLTIVDCGTLTRPLERRVLALATHIAWLLPATVSGAKRAERVLGAVPSHLDGREMIVARHDAAERKPPLRALKALADRRGGPVVLVPHIPDLVETDRNDALEAAEVSLEALGTVLRR